jgi:hypothetical protein
LNNKILPSQEKAHDKEINLNIKEKNAKIEIV